MYISFVSFLQALESLFENTLVSHLRVCLGCLLCGRSCLPGYETWLRLLLSLSALSLSAVPLSPPPTKSLLQTGIRLDRSVNAAKDLSRFIRSFKAIKGIRVTLVQRHTRHRAQISSAQVSKANKHSSSMFGYSHSPASQPCQASTWWSSPPGHAAVPSWQPPTDSHWWSHPPPSSPAWVRPATHTQIWGEPPAQWMHPGTGYYPPNQPLAIMAYPNQQLMPQQQCHYIQTPLCPAQHSLRNRTWC